MKKFTITALGAFLALLTASSMFADDQQPQEKTLTGPASGNIVDEVAWIVGDEAIYRSEIEEQYATMLGEGVKLGGAPYCVIPENIAVEKLYLHQAKIDTIEAQEGSVQARADQRINQFIAGLGSRERVESYFRKSLPEIRATLVELIRNNSIVEQVQYNLTKDVKATPGDVRKYFNSLPKDSLPYVPMQVEVQIITLNPQVPRQEIEDVKARLRDFTERVNSGKTDFSTLAILYSEDDGSRALGGELGFHGKADFVPEFSNVAFNLNDPKKVSRIVETEYGYHIIQLIEKRGDQVNLRHILLRPKVSKADIDDAVVRLDSLYAELGRGTFSFEDAAQVISMDKDTRNNKGIMINQNSASSRFEMQDLPPEIATTVETMEIGDISKPFVMKDSRKNRDVVAIVKLKDRIPGHQATLSDDFSMLKNMYENDAKQNILKNWVEKKIKETYVKINDGWDNCEFRYSGWQH